MQCDLVKPLLTVQETANENEISDGSAHIILTDDLHTFGVMCVQTVFMLAERALPECHTEHTRIYQQRQ